MDNIVEFTGVVMRKIFGDTPEFRIFALHVEDDVIREKGLKRTKYGSISICGSLPELGEGLTYNITAKEEYSQKNSCYNYKVSKIAIEKPNNERDFYVFLKEILTENQAKTLWEVYPDIVQRIIDNNLDDVDLEKTKGIKEYTFNVIKKKVI